MFCTGRACFRPGRVTTSARDEGRSARSGDPSRPGSSGRNRTPRRGAARAPCGNPDADQIARHGARWTGRSRRPSTTARSRYWPPRSSERSCCLTSAQAIGRLRGFHSAGADTPANHRSGCRDRVRWRAEPSGTRTRRPDDVRNRKEPPSHPISEQLWTDALFPIASHCSRVTGPPKEKASVVRERSGRWRRTSATTTRAARAPMSSARKRGTRTL